MMKFTVSPLLWKTTSDQPNCFKNSINFFFTFISKKYFSLWLLHNFFLGSEIFLVASLKNKKEKYIDKHEINSCMMETKLPK